MSTGSVVIAMMYKRGITGLPRNYELVYEALNKSNPDLTRDFVALGNKPSQPKLDEVGKKYFTHHHQVGIVDTAQEKISDELNELISQLNKENTTLKDYNKVLDDKADHLNQIKDNPHNQDIFNIMDTLVQATGKKAKNSKEIIERVVNTTKELKQVKKQLDEYKVIANTDPLTHLANRRAFNEAMKAVYENNASISATALILLDIDNFKQFNDTYGHPVGDRVLKVVAKAMNNKLRQDCMVARTGGEEFGIIVSNASIESVKLIAERVRASVADISLKDRKSGTDFGQITISLGICMASECTSSHQLYSVADEMLYLSKSKGKNQFQLYDSGRMNKSSNSRAMYRKNDPL